MAIFGYLYQEIFYRPILNALVFLYQTVAGHDLGLAIIFVTILIRLLLFPFFHKGAKQQMLMQRIQPKVKKIQETHKDDRDKQAQALMELYKEHGVNPFSSFLLLIIQLPVLITLYRIFLSGLGPQQFASLYSFVHAPSSVNAVLLGILDLKARNVILVIIVGIAQYFQVRLAMYRAPGNIATLSQAERIARQTAFIGPIITVVIFFNFPAAVSLYWLVTSLFSIVQQIFVNRHLEKTYGA